MRRSNAVALALAGLAAGVALLSAAPASSGPAAQDRCLRGAWKMSNAASNALLQDLIRNPNMRVRRGVITAAFPREGTMRYGSTDFVLQLRAGDMIMEGTATFIFEAPWSTSRGNLVLGRGRSELVISKFTATKDGRTITVPGGDPIIQRTARGSTPYTCNRTTLRWRIPINDAQTLFRRVD
jgi:hypothetical protein